MGQVRAASAGQVIGVVLIDLSADFDLVVWTITFFSIHSKSMVLMIASYCGQKAT